MQAKLPPAELVWLTVPEAAAVMRLGKNTVYDLCRTGQLPHRKVGVKVHIKREVAESWTPEDAPPLAPVRLRGGRR